LSAEWSAPDGKLAAAAGRQGGGAITINLTLSAGIGKVPVFFGGLFAAKNACRWVGAPASLFHRQPPSSQ